MIKKNYSELFEFTSAQMATLKREYEPLRGKTISVPNVKKMNIMLDRFSKDMLTKLANADIPFISTGAASKLVMKHGMKFTDFKLNMSEADELQCEACWTGYKQVGMKKKGDRQVPNCVKEEDLKEMIGEVNDLRGSLSDAQLERMKQEWKNKPASALTQSVKQTIQNMDAPTRAALKGAGINHISKFANSTLEEVEIEESMVQRVMQTIHDKLKKEGGAAGFDDIAKEVKKEFGITLQKSSLDNMPGVKKHRDGDYILEETIKEGTGTIKGFTNEKEKSNMVSLAKQHGLKVSDVPGGIELKGNMRKILDMQLATRSHLKTESLELEEADLSKSQVKMVHKKADDMSKKDFVKRYGKDGDSVRFATATNMVKKELGIEEEQYVPEQTKPKGEEVMNESYKDKFNATMKKFGINSLGDLKSDEEKKKFFKAVDNAHVAKNEELSAAQKKLPAGLQKAIMKKQGDSKERKKDFPLTLKERLHLQVVTKKKVRKKMR